MQNFEQVLNRPDSVSFGNYFLKLVNISLKVNICVTLKSIFGLISYV